MNEYDVFITLQYLESGLIPSKSFSPEGVADFNASLASLSEEDARRAKRKFRKLWRKIHKNGDLDGEGLKVGSPSPLQKSNRRRAVHREISRAAYKKSTNPQGEHE